MTIWSILRPLEIFNCHLVCIFWGNLVYFSPFWYFGPLKIWQPCFSPGQEERAEQGAQLANESGQNGGKIRIRRNANFLKTFQRLAG
jgi:hypothetical protein